MTVNHYEFNNNKTSIAICAANRPEYFTQVVDSVYRQVGNRPVYVFIDITPDNNKKLQDDQADYALEKIPDATVVKYQSHMGCGKNLITAREYVFSYLRHKRSFILEDDLVLSDGYFDFCENIMDWTDKNYSNVGVVQGWSEYAGKPEDQHLAEKYSPFDITACGQHFWGYLMGRNCYIQVRNIICAYMESFLTGITEYRYRNHQAIYQWKVNLVNQLMHHKQQMSQNCPKPFPNDDKTCQAKSVSQTTGQDSATFTSIYMTNQVRVCPVLGRGYYVGRSGEHFSDAIFERKGFNNWKEHSTHEDSTNTSFKEVRAHEGL